MTATLNVPYYGQVGPGADEHNNDCDAGASKSFGEYAGAVMSAIDTIYHEVMPTGDSYLSVGNLLSGLSKRGIKCEWDVNYALKDLWEVLSNGSPAIALIRYGALASNRFQANIRKRITGFSN